MRSLASVCPCISGDRAASVNHRSSGQVAADLDYNFLDIRAVQLDPVDSAGFAAHRLGPDRMGATEVPAHGRQRASCFSTN